MAVKSNIFFPPYLFSPPTFRSSPIVAASTKLDELKKGLWLPAVLNEKAKARLGDKWFSLSMALRLGPERKWASAATYDLLQLRTGRYYDVVWVHLGLLSPQFNTPQLFVEAVHFGIDGLDFNEPGDGTYLDETARKNRERAQSRTPRKVRDDFFKDLTWPRETRSGTPLSGAGTKRSRSPDDASDDVDDDEEEDDDDDDEDDDEDDEEDDDEEDDDEDDEEDDEEDDDADELLFDLPEKRRTYSPNQKQACLALLKIAGGNKDVALTAINRRAGYEKVTYVNLNRWQLSTVKKNMGRSVNVDFERAVIGHLILTVLEKVDRSRKRALSPTSRTRTRSSGSRRSRR